MRSPRMPSRIGVDLLLVAVLEVCVAAVATVYADGVLEGFAGDGYLEIALAVVALVSLVCMGVVLAVLLRARRRGRAPAALARLALMTHAMLAIPGLLVIWQCLNV